MPGNFVDSQLADVKNSVGLQDLFDMTLESANEVDSTLMLPLTGVAVTRHQSGATFTCVVAA